jgi:hypothetical protein
VTTTRISAYDLQLTRYAEEGWRAMFYPAGRTAHSQTAAVDGGDPEAFLTALERVLEEPIPREVRPRLFANDLRALTAAAAQPRPSLEDVLPSMAMPVLLLVGEAGSGSRMPLNTSSSTDRRERRDNPMLYTKPRRSLISLVRAHAGDTGG